MAHHIKVHDLRHYIQSLIEKNDLDASVWDYLQILYGYQPYNHMW